MQLFTKILYVLFLFFTLFSLFFVAVTKIYAAPSCNLSAVTLKVTNGVPNIGQKVTFSVNSTDNGVNGSLTTDDSSLLPYFDCSGVTGFTGKGFYPSAECVAKTITYPASMNWTHTWQVCDITGCSPTCSESIPLTIYSNLAPVCDTTQLTQSIIAGAPAELGDSVTFQANGTQGSTFDGEVYDTITDPTGAFVTTGNLSTTAMTCSAWQPIWPFQPQCSISATAPTGTYKWVHNWKNCAHDDCSITSAQCTKEFDFPVSGYTVSGNVSLAPDGNLKGGLPPIANATLTLIGGSNPSTITDINGNYTLQNISPGSYNATLNPPSGYYLTTANPIPVTIGPTAKSVAANFGVSNYTISGNVTNKNGSAYVNATVKLSTGQQTATDGSGHYVFTGFPSGNYTVTLVPPINNYVTTANPVTVTVGPISNNVVVNFGVDNLVSVSGNVFIDTNGNGTKDFSESNYATGALAIALSNGSSQNTVSGTYGFSGLLPGSYVLSFNNTLTPLPFGYFMTEPINGPPPSFLISLGSSCSTSGKSGTCDAIGSISNLNFGISNQKPWMQIIGLDTLFENGYVNPIPPSPNPACKGAYASVNASSTTSGIAYIGNTAGNFGSGQASSNNWVVGGASYGYPNYFQTSTRSSLYSSYTYLLAKAKSSGLSLPPLPCDQANCTLPIDGSFKDAVYQNNGDLVLNTNRFTGNNNYVILVNGNLIIKGAITIDAGTTVIFSTAKNITIDKSVGTAPSCPPVPQIAGFYSTDQNFIIQGNNDCSIGGPGPDQMFNVAGNVIVNAGNTGSTLQNQRNLCLNNLSYPSFTISERPDLLLNTPDFLKQQNYIFQEIAP